LLTTRVAVDGEGSPTSYAEWLLSPLDGPVLFAMRQPRPGVGLRCNALPDHVREGVGALFLEGDGGSELAQDSDTDGVLVVMSPDPIPRLRYRDTQPGQHSWSAGVEWIDQHDVGIDYLLPTGGGAPTLLHAANQDPEGLGISGKVLMNGPNALYQVGNYGAFGIMAFDGTGSHPLLRKVGDPSQGYGNIGTDGIDLVWSYGEGRPPGEPIYPTISIYTSPYATTTQGLVPRRLRSDQGKLFGLEEGQFVVGCGFAARMLSTGQDLEVVRLGDGAGWTLLGKSGWRYMRPLGLTCDELVATVQVPLPVARAVVRIRLDALGDPTPPD
jgi:hypothetical protein